MLNVLIVTVLFARNVGFINLIMLRKLMNSTVTTVTKIETPQYAAHAYPVNTLITWKRARNATNVVIGFACHAPNTRMMATIIVGTTVRRSPQSGESTPYEPFFYFLKIRQTN